MTILEDLYYGRIRFDEKPITPKSEHEQLSTAVVVMEDAIRRELSADGKHLYAEYTGAVDRISDIVALDSFKQGFQLGVKLMVTALESGG